MKQFFFFFFFFFFNSSKSRSSQDDNLDILQFSLKDMYAIREIADQKKLFRLIVNSICPPIYGHELVKGSNLFIQPFHFFFFFIIVNFIFYS